MRKSTLIEKLSQQFLHLSVANIGQHVNLIIETMGETLSQQQRIELRGFGSFSLHYRASYQAHNPITGEYVTTPARHRPHFKPGKKLRLLVKTKTRGHSHE